MPEKRVECFRLLFGHLAWIEHQFLSGIRDSRKEGGRWGMMRGVGGVRKSIHHSWLAKGLGLGLLCWGFKEVQEEIPMEEACTLQIGSVAFPAGQCTSPQLHSCHRLFDQDGQPDFAPCDFCLFPKLRGCRYETIEEMKEAVTKVIDTLTHEGFHGALQKLLERYNKCIRRRLHRRGQEFHECTINKSAHTKKVWKLFNDPRIYIYIYIYITKSYYSFPSSIALGRSSRQYSESTQSWCMYKSLLVGQYWCVYVEE